MRESRRPPLFKREALSSVYDERASSFLCIDYLASNLKNTIFACVNQIKRWIVWLCRIHQCRGFGIQSPTDYAFVRYVVNEHWPYYAYAQFSGGDWLTRKLGRLYFRLANWRQPRWMLADEYQAYWKAGCHSLQFTPHLESVELARLTIEDCDSYDRLLSKCNEQSVLVIEGIFRDWQRWKAIEQDKRVGTTFDLYYCGILFFDKNRYHHHYTINF